MGYSCNYNIEEKQGAQAPPTMNPSNPNNGPLPRDWKGSVGLLVAMCGLVLPIALWQYDLSATSVSTRVISSVPLNFSKLPTVDDVEVRLGGRILTKPYVSTIVISNDGSKPIPTANFEVPLQISAIDGVKLVRATPTRSSPEELVPRVVVGQDSFRLEPLLLNQGDEIKIVVVTEGGQPSFKITGRINGVRKLEIADETQRKLPLWMTLYRLFNFALGTVLYPLAAATIVRKARPSYLMLCGLTYTALLGSTRNFSSVVGIVDIGKWPITAFQYGTVMIVFVLAYITVRPVRQ